MTDTAESLPVTPDSPSRWREIVETAALTLLVFLVVRLAFQNFRVEGDSMYPTLHSGEYVLVDKVEYMLHPPRRGDIIVFQAVPALQPNTDFIKRIIGIPGDTVAVRNGSVYIDGRRLPESYLREKPDYTFAPRRVPPDDYFVLGDHRNNSYDSSKWTTTPWLARKYIIGKAWIAYWPPGRVAVYGTPSYPRP